MYYCLLRELVYHLNLNYTKFRLAFLEVSSPTTARTTERRSIVCLWLCDERRDERREGKERKVGFIEITAMRHRRGG